MAVTGLPKVELRPLEGDHEKLLLPELLADSVVDAPLQIVKPGTVTVTGNDDGIPRVKVLGTVDGQTGAEL